MGIKIKRKNTRMLGNKNLYEKKAAVLLNNLCLLATILLSLSSGCALSTLFLLVKKLQLNFL